MCWGNRGFPQGTETDTGRKEEEWIRSVQRVNTEVIEQALTIVIT